MAGLTDCADGVGISQMVSLGFLVGAGGLAQHVIGIGIAFAFTLFRTLHAAFYAFAEEPRHIVEVIDGLFFVQNLAGKQQSPCRGIDQR